MANSLYQRNGFSKDKSFLIWTLYTLSSFLGSESSNRTVIHYDGCLKNWTTKLKEVAKTLGVIISNYKKLYKSVESFINPEFQHSKSSVEGFLKENGVPIMTVSLYNFILTIEKSPELLNPKILYTEKEVDPVIIYYHKYINNKGYLSNKTKDTCLLKMVQKLNNLSPYQYRTQAA
ncbi:hypothetical protein ACFX4N_29520 [Priestia sp. YIM B13551]|uniref:hypothetical protein n=1 Tax=Priestia TaxID=2800373 RepID=UPI00263ABF03|nr:hypothetical protein [Priestia megaterium]MDN4866196.1 hypothetical protein [Priestia megaterium]